MHSGRTAWCHADCARGLQHRDNVNVPMTRRPAEPCEWLLAQSEEESKQLQGLKALQGLGKSSDKVYGPLQRTFQVAADGPALLAGTRKYHASD